MPAITPGFKALRPGDDGKAQEYDNFADDARKRKEAAIEIP
jgi:hypothetical protein